MHTWILIIILTSSSGSDVHSIEFNSKTACIQAREAAIKQMEASKRGHFFKHIQCTSKR